MVLENVFLTGGSGTLGAELINQSQKFKINFISPPSKECDVTDYESVLRNLRLFDGELVVHAAAYINIRETEKDCDLAMCVNVLGTINIIKACKQLNKKLIFISTDYVFDGERGNYKIQDPINPISKYAKTKGAAELLVRTFENSLVIRTSFFGYDFPYDKALVDQWSTKDYVDIIAPLVLKEIKLRKAGIVHVGTRRSTTYDKAVKRSPQVKKAFLNDIDIKIPKDVSLCLEG